MPALVSIIMAAYQAERFLAASLDSALAQTHPQTEIIVINDGSTDGTAAILERYRRDQGITVITQSNTGQAVALNRGLAAARGDYIKFFDADDILSPDFIAAQLTALRDHPDHLAYASWSRFYKNPAEAIFTPKPGWHHSDSPVDWLLETWADYEPMYQCALFLLPRPLLDRCGGWDERLTLINDFEFFTRLILASAGIRFASEARLYYRSGISGSVSGRTTRPACASAILSTQLAARHLIAREDSPRTRLAAAAMLRSLSFDFYPAHADLLASLEPEIARLGGSRRRPAGGLVFRLISRLFGWRTALRIRRAR